LEKLLEDAQIKLSVVASDIFGVSGRQMMAALIGGQTNPQALAQLARGRMRAKITQLEEAFTGHVTDHHRLLLTKMLTADRRAGRRHHRARRRDRGADRPFRPGGGETR
jgi:transposase